MYAVSRLLGCVAALSLGFAVPLQAQVNGWGEYAIISNSLNVSEGRLCTGVAGRALACPSYAPSLTTAGDVSITGNLTAAKFLGDGSELTGVAAASADRIVSGTNNATSMLAISASGYISITQAGSNSAWFDPTRGLVALGISTTGTVSGTAGYFSGNVGIGTGTPARSFHIYGASGSIQRLQAGSSLALLEFQDTSGYSYFGSNSANAVIQAGGSERLRVASTGNVGIGTSTPQATLQVSGSFIVSTTGQTTTPTLYANTSGNVGIGTSAPTAKLDVATNTNSASGAIHIGNDGNSTSLMSVNQRALFGYDAAGYAVVQGSTTKGIQFNVNNSTFGLGTAMTLTFGGNVGIGTTAPSTTLSVSGTVFISSNTEVSGTMKIAGTGSESCTAASYGTVRINPSTGRMEICHP